MAGERILLVEDGADVRHFLAESVLQPAGYDVLTAADGVEGFTLARDLQPDLVIVDYLMPRQDGLEMLAALRNANFERPIILMTAEGSEALAVHALRLGVSDYLIKPFNPDDLLTAVDRVLREHWTRQITRNVPAQLLGANLQMELRLRELDTLVEIGKRVTSLLDLQSVLNQVIGAAVHLSHAEHGMLLLLDESTRELYLYASTDPAQDVTGAFRLPVADSLAGRVVRTCRPLVLTSEDLHKIKTDYLVYSLVYVPLVLQQKVIGVLGVTNREHRQEFEPHTLQLLSVLADFTAIAIDNARLYAATEHERDTLNTIMRDTEDAIIVVDPRDHILLCNPAACKVFNLGQENYQGRLLSDVIQHQAVLGLFSKGGQGRRGRNGEISVDNGQRTLNAQMSVVQGVGKIAVMQDITYLKELDRIKSEFVTTVSHDLRSPLTAILSYVELVERSGPLNEAQAQFIGRIHTSVQSITVLISDLLELGKIEAGFDKDREPVRLDVIIRQVVEAQRQLWEAKEQDLLVQLPGDLPLLFGNPLRLRQMISNLMENAIKYTPARGRIRVSVGMDSDFVVLRVADTGIGIPQKDQPYIFDKFYRSDQAIDEFEGTGLGLSIVKGIVEQHGGRIWVDSHPGKGTVFTVMLPCYDQEST